MRYGARYRATYFLCDVRYHICVAPTRCDLGRTGIVLRTSCAMRSTDVGYRAQTATSNAFPVPFVPGLRVLAFDFAAPRAAFRWPRSS
eukprot:2032544-Rhodomonas_salina.2